MELKYVKDGNEFHLVIREDETFYVCADKDEHERVMYKDFFETVTIKKPEIGSLVYVPDYNIFSFVHDVDIYDFKESVLVSSVAASRHVPLDKVQLAEETKQWVSYQNKQYYVEYLVEGNLYLQELSKTVDVSETESVEPPHFEIDDRVVFTHDSKTYQGVITSCNWNYIIVKTDEKYYVKSLFELVKLEM